jgi:hypothetical protein
VVVVRGVGAEEKAQWTTSYTVRPSPVCAGIPATPLQTILATETKRRKEMDTDITNAIDEDLGEDFTEWQDADDVLTVQTLCAYVDGELQPVEVLLVDRLLEDNPTAQRQLARLEIITTLLQAAYANTNQRTP